MRRAIVRSIPIVVIGLLAACSEPAAPGTLTPQPTATRARQTTVLPTENAPTPSPLLQRGGEFREIVARDAENFHPYLTTDPASASFQANVFAGGLTARDPDTQQPVPNMAESWTVSPDGKTFTFKLRQDLKWSDGRPITANDFQWTYDQASKPANKYPYLENLKDITSYKAKDDYTLAIALKEAVCTGIITVDSIIPLPKHIWEKLPWGDAKQNPEITSPSVVSGPYKLQEWKKGDHATFVRNDLFFRGPPLFDRYSVRIVPDPDLEWQALSAGEVDAAPVSIDHYAEARQNSKLREYAWSPAAETWDYIGLNLRDPFLQDVQVRRALSFAIPRQSIIDNVFHGLARPLYSAYASTSWVYNPDVLRYDYNLDTARSMLQKAGYKSDANGRLLDKNGRPVKLRILFNTANPQHFQIASIAHEQLQKLGIDSEAAGLEFQPLLDYLRKEPFDYDLYVLGWRAPLDPSLLAQAWSQANIPGLNAGAYVNKDLEKLYDQSNHPPCDLESRKKVFQKIQSTLANDVPYIFLSSRTGYAFLNSRVVPNEPTPLGISYRPEKWYMLAP